MDDRQKNAFLIPGLMAPDKLRDAIDRSYHEPEEPAVASLLAGAELEPSAADQANRLAQSLVTAVRVRKKEQGLAMELFKDDISLGKMESEQALYNEQIMPGRYRLVNRA